MIIYLEGPDGSGKSALRKVLYREIKVRLLDFAPFGITGIIENGEDFIPTRPTNPKRLTLERLISKLTEIVNDLHVIYICDRGPISDIIYRTFDQYRPLMSFTRYYKFWMDHRNLITTVYCDNDKSEEVMLNRGDDNQIAIVHYKSIRYLYQQIMPLFTPVNYDFTTIVTEERAKSNACWIIGNLLGGLNYYKTHQKSGGEKE
jgi:hypothetical protein